MSVNQLMGIWFVVLLVALAAWLMWLYVWLPAQIAARQRQTQAAVNKVVSSAQAARDMGRADEAIKLYDKAIALQPDNPQLYAECGLIKLAKREPFEALAYFDRATRLNPEYYFGSFMASLCHCNLKNFQKALAINNEIINSVADDPQGFVGYLGRGAVFIHLRKFNRALGDFEKAYKLKPEVALTSCAVAEASCYLGAFERGLKFSGQAIEQMASLNIAYLWRGWAKYGLGRYEDALKDCDRSIQQDQKNPKGYQIRGQIYQAMDRLENALADFEESLKLYQQEDWTEFAAEVSVSLAEVRQALGKETVDGE